MNDIILNMIKKGLLDFLKCLKFYFVPLGILSIFTVIGLYASIVGLTNTIKAFFTSLGEIANQVNIDWSKVWSAFGEEITKVDMSGGINAFFSTIFSSSWILHTLEVVARTIFGSSVTAEQVSTLGTQTIGSILLYLILFVLMVIIGVVVGALVTTFLVRKELTKVKIGKLILYGFLNFFFWTILIILINLLASLAQWVSILVSVIFLISFVFICLLEGYLFYGIKKIKLKEVMHIKNILKLYAIEAVILVGVAAVSALLILIFKWFVGIYIALPFIEIGIIAINLSAENYVVNLVETKQDKTKTIKNEG